MHDPKERCDVRTSNIEIARATSPYVSECLQTDHEGIGLRTFIKFHWSSTLWANDVSFQSSNAAASLTASLIRKLGRHLALGRVGSSESWRPNVKDHFFPVKPGIILLRLENLVNTRSNTDVRFPIREHIGRVID